MANPYNYLESMIETVLKFVRKEWKCKQKFHDGTGFSSRKALEDDLSHRLWGDMVNCNFWWNDAENCLYHNWELLLKAMEAIGIDKKSLFTNGPCYADSLIRRYLLCDAIRNALDILEANGEIFYGPATVNIYDATSV